MADAKLGTPRASCAANRLPSELGPAALPKPDVRPRDVLDALHLHRHVLGLGALCWAACGKDPGFTPLSLLDLLRRRGRVRAEDLARLELTEPVDLHALKRTWLEALDSVEPFVASRPAQEIGCLYYSAAKRAFVDPRAVTDAVPHFGRPGGVLPRITVS